MDVAVVVEPSLPPVRRRIGTLAVLGDSTAVGIGDPLGNGRWRGVGLFVAEAVGVRERGFLVNVAVNGARVGDLRRQQLPVALAHAPDVALMIAGMNDTLRADFDEAQITSDLDFVAESLTAAGCVVVTVRFHDHTRLFRLPASLREVFQGRIARLNVAIDHMATHPGVIVVDLEGLPVDDLAMWSVDRLHPSEMGHRYLARAVADALASAGFAVPRLIGLACADGKPTTRATRAWWMIREGIPWAVRRSRDLLPYMALIVIRSAWSMRFRQVSR